MVRAIAGHHDQLLFQQVHGVSICGRHLLTGTPHEEAGKNDENAYDTQNQRNTARGQRQPPVLKYESHSARLPQIKQRDIGATSLVTKNM